jgi:two-component system response regulator HydG
MSLPASLRGRSGAPPDALTLLIVDDDLLHARLLKANLERPGRLRVEVVGSAEEALARIAQSPVDAVLSDVTMPGMDGIEFVRRVRETDTALPVILMTAHATLERAVDGIRAGATEFLPKPINANAIVALVERAIAERPMREAMSARQERLATAEPKTFLYGDHARLDAVREFAEQVAATPMARVLITGESGTGKSLLARAIHELSGAGGRFVEINCAALPPQLLESELFGHEKGAFTDAKGMKRGLFETADRGTLLLDEIGTMPLELQAKLLLVLERREVRRLGGTTPIPVRARIVAATNEDLRRQVQERAFRQDLLYRLDVASVEMPPLRDMPEVIPPMAERFLADLCAEIHRPVPPCGPASFAPLLAYPWPGNARELRNAVERALIFHRGPGPIVVEPPNVGGPGAPDGPGGGSGLQVELGLTLDEVERRYIAATLETTTGDLSYVAGRLGISRKTLWDKRRRYGL